MAAPLVLGGLLGAAGLGGSIGGMISGDAQRKKDQEQADFIRNLGRERALNALSAQSAPGVSGAMQKRLAALEEESKPVPFSQDPTIQGERAQLLGGGARALSSIQNKQRAFGLQGGFSNIGSQQDVQDRLGGALSELAQKSRLEKESKADRVAQFYQQIDEAQNAFENARQAARAAIQQMYGQLVGVGGTIAGSYFKDKKTTEV
jgi:hypothetical protein